MLVNIIFVFFRPSSIKRYVSSDNRVPQMTPESTMNIFGLEVTVDPDMFFYNGRTLEIVKL